MEEHIPLIYLHKKKLQEDGFQFNKKLSDPMYSPKQPFSSINYRPEIDGTAECDPKQHTYYQNLIGILRWAVELGRIDIHFEVSVLSQYLASPRIGHLHQALHIFKYFTDFHIIQTIRFYSVQNITHISKTATLWKS